MDAPQPIHADNDSFSRGTFLRPKPIKAQNLTKMRESACNTLALLVEFACLI